MRTYLFNPYTRRPSQSDKNFIHPSYGGYCNTPVRDRSNGYTLPNCTAGVHGMWLSCITEAVDLATAKKLEHDMCWNNAEVYWGYTEDGFERGQTPKLCAIMVWEGKGSLMGHVMTVTKVLDNGDVEATGSDLSGTTSNGRFWYTRTYRKSNGYNFDSDYIFRGFIYCPIEFVYECGSPVPRNKNVKQIEVKTSTLNVRPDASVKQWPQGYAKKGIYDVLEEVESDYHWYRIGPDMWIANDKDETWCTVYPAERPGKPVPRNEKVNQLDVKATTLKARKTPSLKGEILGYVTPGIYDFESETDADGYHWYQIQGFWCANDKDKTWILFLPKADPKYEMVLQEISGEQKKDLEDYCRKNGIAYTVKEL